MKRNKRIELCCGMIMLRIIVMGGITNWQVLQHCTLLCGSRRDCVMQWCPLIRLLWAEEPDGKNGPSVFLCVQAGRQGGRLLHCLPNSSSENSLRAGWLWVDDAVSPPQSIICDICPAWMGDWFQWCGISTNLFSGSLSSSSIITAVQAVSGLSMLHKQNSVRMLAFTPNVPGVLRK